jgi:hypothetical protein
VPDLATIGDDDDDDIMFRLIAKYGDQAMGALDKVSGLKDRIVGKK